MFLTNKILGNPSLILVRRFYRCAMYEKVQQQAAKLVMDLKAKSYQDYLKELNLINLEDRRKRGDLIQVFKLLKGVEDMGNKKSKQEKVSDDMQKYFFINITANSWNNSPNYVVEAPSLSLV